MTPDRPLDPPDHGDLPDLSEDQMAAVLDELWTDYDWREEHHVDEAWNLALRNSPYEVEALAKEIAAEDLIREMNRHATERAIADGLIDELGDMFGPGSMFRRQGE